jgi:cyclophilin family peptidyl-prolyl cis-trans isomerase/HEAT repeat protein
MIVLGRLAVVSLIVLASAAPTAMARRGRGSRHPAAAIPEAQAVRRILEIEDKRISKDRFLLQALSHPSLKVRRTALLALGRIGDSSALDEMANLMNRKDDTLKGLTAFSLGLIGGDIAPKLLTQVLALNKKPDVLAPVLIAIGRVGNQETLNPLSDYTKPNFDVRIQEAACQGIGLSWSGPSEKWGVPPGLMTRLINLARGQTQPALAAAFALSRYKGDPTLLNTNELADAVSRAELVFGRAFLLRTLGKVRAPLAAQVLAKELTSSTYGPIKIEAAKGLANQAPTLISTASLTQALGDSSADVVVTVLETLSALALPTPSLTSVMQTIRELLDKSPSHWIQGAALRTLARLDPTAARPRIEKILATPNSPLLPAATYAFGISATPDDWDRVAGYIMSTIPRIAEEAIESVGTQPEGMIPNQVRAALKRALERGDVGTTAMIGELVEKARWKDFAPSLIAVYPLLKRRDDVEAKQSVLNALEAVGDNQAVPLLQQALGDPDRGVALAAAAALKTITNVDHSAEVPPNSRYEIPLAPDAELHAAVRSRATLATSRGRIEIQFLDVAPMTAANFVKLARRHFYDGLTFHRIVPNFVAQGGDPRGDGFGGPGYLIRDEVSPLRHSRGTLGMATAGKDTAGSQFFINLAPNPHLDARYTVFAEVIKGMEVADRLEVGDKILSVKIN